MKNQFFFILLSLFFFSLQSCFYTKRFEKDISDKQEKRETNQPNIVLILADDLGYADVGYHGSDIKTPNIDKLARDGVRLENFYVAPLCSPTRAGLLTGRYPIRFGMMRAVIPPHRDYGIDPEEDLLPEMLQRAGYNYRSIIGKWHLGKMEEKWLPLHQGFTHFIGCHEGAIDYFTHFRNGKLDWHKNGELYDQKGYATDIIAQESVNFINSVPKDEPYFLYIPFNAPHSPFQAKEIDIAKYPEREGRRKIYAAMVDCMDQGIGRILKAIEKRGDLENTFILFLSDNGGVANIGDNSPMKGAKLTPYEGGIRVPAIAYWKNRNIDGGKILKDRIGYIDIFPTLKESSGLQESTMNALDGISILELLKGTGSLPTRDWYTYFDQSDAKRQQLAIHSGNWKAVIQKDAPDATLKRENDEELFFLDDSHSEDYNARSEQPEIFFELSKRMDEFLDLIKNDQIPRYTVKKPEGN